MSENTFIIDKTYDPLPVIPDENDREALAAFFAALPNRNHRCPSANAQLMRLMDIQFHLLRGDVMICSIPVEGNKQSIGILHGGANAVLGETTGSVAANYLAADGMCAVGANIFITHHRPAKAGRIYCIARLIHAGRTLGSYDLRIYGADGKLTASGSHAVAFIPRSRA